MHVFVTGATGYIGSAIVDDLLAEGHQVTGLAHSDEGADKLRQKGVAVHRGELTDPHGVAVGARACEGVIHTGFINDFARYEEVAEIDHRVVAAIADALAGSGGPFVATSVVTLLAQGSLGTEQDSGASQDIPRAASEATVLEAAGKEVRASVVRLPFTVHGKGDDGFVPALIDLARRKGLAGYVGVGDNRWCAVNRLDAAHLYRFALENAGPGTILHAVAEEGVRMRDIAQTIGEGLGVPVRSIDPNQAEEHFEWLSRFVAVDQPISSALTRAWTGWQPRENGLLTDLRESGYFADPRSGLTQASEDEKNGEKRDGNRLSVSFA